MSDLKKTHRLVKVPSISSRYLADYMSASEMGRRNILTGCKYQSIARIVQHDAAKMAISRFFQSENPLVADLKSEAFRLRNQMADSDFDRDVADHLTQKF
jgi:hypothetical protein